MWRTPPERIACAQARLALAWDLWHWSPHDTQRSFFCAPAQVRVAACGRRWGKTAALAVDIATLALAEAAAGRDCRQLVVAPTDAQARLIGAETQARLQAAEGRGGWPDRLRLDIRQRPGLQITLRPADASPDGPGTGDTGTGGVGAGGAGPSRARILFRTAGRDGRGLRGLWAHRIVCDEAGYIPDPVIDEVLLPMLADVGGDLVMASSPAGRRNVFYRLFCRGEASRGEPDAHGLTVAALQCPSTDNPHINADWLAAMAEELGESRFAQEFRAQFVDDFGAVFRADDIDGCIAADAAVALDQGDLVSAPLPGHLYSAGIDWGRKQDFTVLAILDATAPPARLVGLWRMQGTGWEAQARRVGALVASFAPRRVLADGNSVGDPVAEPLQAAIRAQTHVLFGDGERVPQVERFLFGGESKTRLVDHLTVGLSARGLTYPAHRVLLAELRGFEYRGETAGGRHRMAAKGGGHDDTVMALALAYYAAPQGVPPPPASGLLLGSQVGIGRRAG